MTHNVDLDEISKFGNLADKWWNKAGELKTLHDINPVRLAFIEEYTQLSGKSVVDVGCGGGILSEALCKAGAIVKGIDLADASLEVAQKHAHDNGLAVGCHFLLQGIFQTQGPNLHLLHWQVDSL